MWTSGNSHNSVLRPPSSTVGNSHSWLSGWHPLYTRMPPLVRARPLWPRISLAYLLYAQTSILSHRPESCLPPATLHLDGFARAPHAAHRAQPCSASANVDGVNLLDKGIAVAVHASGLHLERLRNALFSPLFHKLASPKISDLVEYRHHRPHPSASQRDLLQERIQTC